MLAEVLGVYSDCRLKCALEPILLVVKPGAVAALRIRQKSLHLGKALQQIDESLGVVLGDGSNFRGSRPDRPVFVLTEMTTADSRRQWLGNRQHGRGTSMRPRGRARGCIAVRHLRQ